MPDIRVVTFLAGLFFGGLIVVLILALLGVIPP
jgi:hypothetical protein